MESGLSASALGPDRAWFDDFESRHSMRLLQALVARFGLEHGRDASGAAWQWAWEHRDRLRTMQNPVGYLYRVAQSSVRPELRWRQRVLLVESDATVEDSEVDLDLVTALGTLRRNERLAVVLIHAHGWSYAQVADLLGVSVAAVTNHVHRGIRRLRSLQED